MTTIAILGDSHFDISSRFLECVRVHDWIADECDRRNVDLVVHSGDVYERRSVPAERNEVSAWLRRVAARRPVVLVRGNHDADGDLRILGRLNAAHPIHVVETTDSFVIAGVRVSALAWPRESALLGDAPVNTTREELGMRAQDAFRSVLRGYGTYPPSALENDFIDHARLPHLLAMHAMVRGSRTSTGQPLIGAAMEIGLEDLALARAQFVALGHIHLPQDWALPPEDGVPGAPVVYTGSPRRTKFGETEEKSFVLVHFDGTRLVGWERVPVPCTQMHLIEDAWEGGEWVAGFHGYPGAEAIRGSEVRFRYGVDSDQRAAAAVAAERFELRLLEEGAVSVKEEAVVRAKVRARAPEVAVAVKLDDKLDCLWDSRAESLSAERRARLLGRASELDAEDAGR
jgi:DNA repair exonuclease SbcCD nuclease subunit